MDIPSRDSSLGKWDPRKYPVASLILALSAITVFAFWFRVLNWSQVFVGDGVRFLESDCYYHMRRVFLAVHGGLRIPEYDLYMNFPQGFHCNWPPLFDQMIAGTALLLGLGHPSVHLVETVGALLPPVLGALTCVVIFFVARCFMATPWALVSAGVFSIFPFHVQLSVLGRPDHHVAVVLFSSLLLLCMLQLARPPARPGRMALLSIAAGILLALNLEIWVGSLLFILIVIGWFGLLFLLNIRQPKRLEGILLPAFGLFLAAALFLWPVAARTPWAQSGELRWDALSSLHLLLLSACAAGALLLRIVLKCIELNKAGTMDVFRQTHIRIHLILSGLLALGVVYVVCFQILPVLMGSSKWIFKQDRLLLYVQETLPLSWPTAAADFTGIVFLSPLLMLHLIYRGWKDGRVEQTLLLGVWWLVAGACTIGSERFADVFSIIAAVFIGHFVFLLFRAGAAQRRVAATLGVLILCVSLWPTAGVTRSYVRNARLCSVSELYDMCLWLREHTPATRGYDDLVAKPEYSILTMWETGNALTYLARRPNVANNFLGWPENHEANLAPYRFFVADSLPDAEAILDDYGVRYVIIGETILSKRFGVMLDALGLDPKEYFTVNEKGQSEVSARALNSMALRLYLRDGKNEDKFRLVFESPAKRMVAGRLRGRYKIFEYSRTATWDTSVP